MRPAFVQHPVLRFLLLGRSSLSSRGFAVVVDLLFGDQRRIAVEIRVGKQPCGRAGVVEDVEEQLAVVVADAGAAADDLLELGHRADDARQHDVLAGRRIDAGREQLRRGEDDRRVGLEVLKAAQVAAADVALVGMSRGTHSRDTARTRSLLRLFSARRISSACS